MRTEPLARPALEALARGAVVPRDLRQQGGTCGFYGERAVMARYEALNPNHAAPLVKPDDAARLPPGWTAPREPTGLLEVATDAGFTKTGEMFVAEELATHAELFRYGADVHTDVDFREVRNCLDRGHPALIPFDVDLDGNPGTYDGKRAHWAVVEGHFREDGTDYVVATHGWTLGHHIWPVDDLLTSTHQLNRTDYPRDEQDIGGSLKARVVEIVPQGG